MKVNLRVNEPNYIEVLIEGEDASFPNALRELLVEEKDVEFAAYNVPHPQIGVPVLFLRTKSKKALDVLADAVAKLKKEAIEFKSEIKGAKKPKEKSK